MVQESHNFSMTRVVCVSKALKTQYVSTCNVRVYDFMGVHTVCRDLSIAIIAQCPPPLPLVRLVRFQLAHFYTFIQQ